MRLIEYQKGCRVKPEELPKNPRQKKKTMTLKRPRKASCANISSASECFQYQLLEGSRGRLLRGTPRGYAL